ncbi:MAG: hypothetical protein GY899_02625 [Verrucomicrobiaceae bacterium]|nr:hypothetical protein [Verrucomicrobiaceae bacterium]
MKFSISKILIQFIRIIFLLIGIVCCFSIFEPSLFDPDHLFDPDYIALKILCLFLFCAGISLIYFSLRAWPKVIGFFEYLKTVKMREQFAKLRKLFVFQRGIFFRGLILGFLIWAICEPITGEEEAIDAGIYLPLGLLITGIIASFPSPKHCFSAALGIYVGQVVFMAFVPTGFGSLWPITAIFLVPAMLISMLGGLIAYIISRKRRPGNQKPIKDKE